MHRKTIKKDMFNIVGRLKKIDSGYYIVFNYITNKYEVHNSKQLKDSYCLTCPYSRLDSRLLDFVYSTSLVHNKNLLEEIECHNKAMEKESISCTKDYIETNLKQVYDVCKSSTKDYDITKGLSTKWL